MEAISFVKSLFVDPVEHIAANQANPDVCGALTMGWICSIVRNGREGCLKWCKEVSQHSLDSDYYRKMKRVQLSLPKQKFVDEGRKIVDEYARERDELEKTYKSFERMSVGEKKSVDTRALKQRTQEMVAKGKDIKKDMNDGRRLINALTSGLEEKRLNLHAYMGFKGDEGWPMVGQILRTPERPGVSGCIFSLFVRGETRRHAVAMAFVPSDGGIRQYYYDPNAHEVLVGNINQIAEAALNSMRRYGYVKEFNIVTGL